MAGTDSLELVNPYGFQTEVVPGFPMSAMHPKAGAQAKYAERRLLTLSARQRFSLPGCLERNFL